MTSHFPAHHETLMTMADGTIKQINPFSGTEVWTVPGRGDRPLSTPVTDPAPLGPGDRTAACAFCEDNYVETPPEKARIVRHGGGWDILRGLGPGELTDTRAEFRRVPNLYEIVSYDYWNKNYGYEMGPDQRRRMEAYLSTAEGRAHVTAIVRKRLGTKGRDASDEDLYALAPAYFGGGHDVIIARRHYVDGASDTSQLASSGTLTPEEHHAFITFTVDSIRDLYESNRYAPYVAVFQNWLSPAGASFEHLHKQLVAIDERGVSNDEEISKLRRNPNMYNEYGINYAFYNNLIIADNASAVLVAGIGHRYPTMTVYSKSASPEPWNLSPAETRDFSDLLHAAHAATGPGVASNEEWHYKPIDLDIPMPLRVNLKWRVSTLAGFEGGTKIYVNTLSPRNIRDRMVASLHQLRAEGKIADGTRIGPECAAVRNCLLYNPALH